MVRLQEFFVAKWVEGILPVDRNELICEVSPSLLDQVEGLHDSLVVWHRLVVLDDLSIQVKHFLDGLLDASNPLNWMAAIHKLLSGLAVFVKNLCLQSVEVGDLLCDALLEQSIAFGWEALQLPSPIPDSQVVKHALFEVFDLNPKSLGLLCQLISLTFQLRVKSQVSLEIRLSE